MDIYTIIVAGHIIGAVLGTGGATVAELQITRALKDKRVSDEERALMHVNYTMIRVGMAFILVSAVAMFLYSWRDGFDPYLVTDAKLLMKDLMFVAIFVNAIMLTKHKVPLWLGASISFTSWWGATLLGVASGLSYSFVAYLAGYIVAIFIVAAISHIFRSISINNRMDAKTAFITLVLIVAIAAIAYYQLTRNESARQAVTTETVQELAIYENLSATADYVVPGGYHDVKFTFAVDDAGVVQKVTAYDFTDPDQLKNLAEFNVDRFAESVTKIVAGKKLSELQAIDKVGTSSLTTKAFNESLEKVKEQL